MENVHIRCIFASSSPELPFHVSNIQLVRVRKAYAVDARAIATVSLFDERYVLDRRTCRDLLI
jgi:hypothetical protein